MSRKRDGVWFRPLPATRVANAIGGASVPIWPVIFSPVEPSDAYLTVVGWAALVLMPLLALRGARMAMHVGENTVTVRGQFRTRRVPRSSVLSVDPRSTLPMLVWEDATGRVRRTPIVFLSVLGPVIPRYERHRDDLLAEVRRVLAV